MIQRQYLVVCNQLSRTFVTETDIIELANQRFQALFTSYARTAEASIALAQLMCGYDANFMAVIATSDISAFTRYTAHLEVVLPPPGSEVPAYVLTVTAAHSRIPFQMWYIDEYGANPIDQLVKFTAPGHTNDT